MRISEATRDQTPLAVHFPGGAVLNIVYAPATYTVAELEELQESNKDPQRIIDSIRRLLVSWDLTDDDGNPIPVEKPAVVEEGDYLDPPVDPLRHVPTNIFMALVKAVNEDQSAGEASKA